VRQCDHEQKMQRDQAGRLRRRFRAQRTFDAPECWESRAAAVTEMRAHSLQHGGALARSVTVAALDGSVQLSQRGSEAPLASRTRRPAAVRRARRKLIDLELAAVDVVGAKQSADVDACGVPNPRADT